MTAFRFVAIPTKLADSVRAHMRSPVYGHPAHTEVATGHGPCRHCLRSFEVGKDKRILFTHNRFSGIDSLPLPGPVFIHAEPCQRYPDDAGFPEDLRTHPVTLEAYGFGRRLLDQVYVTDGNAEPAIERLFARPEVDYLLVCDTQAGCYDFRIERRDASEAKAPESRNARLVQYLS